MPKKPDELPIHVVAGIVGSVGPPRLDGAFDNAVAGVAAGVMVDVVLDSSLVDVFALGSMVIQGLNGKDWETVEVLAIRGAQLGSLSMFSNIVLSSLCGMVSHQ